MPNGSLPPTASMNSGSPDADVLELSRALVFLARHLDRPCEETQACRLLSEVMRSHPGNLQDSWWNWLLLAGRSVNLALRVSDVPPRDVTAILRSGACVVAERQSVQDQRVNIQKRDSHRITLVGEHSTPQPERKESTASQQSQLEPKQHPALLRVIIASKEPDLGSAHHHHEKPWVILWKLLSPDQKDLWAVAVICGVAGLLMLSVPVTAQQLVRTVTFATLYQPIIVLSLMLLGLLGFVATLQALQIYVAEIIQRRLFIRVAGQVSQRLTHTDISAWRQMGMPELVNRFLEVAIVQKVTAALMVDGIAILLTTLISMSVMAFYHPFLLGYDVMLLVLLATIFFGFGRNGVKTAIQESRTKYGVLSWLEDMARCPGIFRTAGVELLAMQRTDVLCADYLGARRSHFSILMRQIVLVLLLQVIASTTLLGLGGFLVLNEQLTLGQLVAAELIVAMIVASFAKLGKHLEGWYDLLASVDKLSHLLDLPVEAHDGLIGLPRQGPAEFTIRGLPAADHAVATASTEHAEPLRIDPSQTAALLNWSPSLTQDLADSLRGLRGASSLHFAIDGVEIEYIRPDVLRRHASVARDPEFLPGTIAENIHLSRPQVTEADIREACDVVGLTEGLQPGSLTLATQILPDGWPLNILQQRQLILARALAGKPRLLFIDHLLDVFNGADIQQIWARLSHFQSETTILIATTREDVARLTSHVASGPIDVHRQESRTH